jgi:hypothetical protein
LLRGADATSVEVTSGIDGGSEVAGDSNTADTGPSAHAADSSPDVASDAGPDAGVDAGPDAGVDAGPDAGVDAGPDAGVDAGPDMGPDTALDTGADRGPDSPSSGDVPPADARPDAAEAGPPPPNHGAGEPPELVVPPPTELAKHRYQKAITIDTAAAGVMGDVAGFPLAVQLDAGNFDFAQAQPLGQDVRFSTAGGQLLPYSIELWDAAGQQAALWVKVDVKGNDGAQSIRMHWGNPNAQSAASSKAVFDMASGWVGVYHLNQDGNTNPGGYRDSSSHGVHGTGVRMEPGSLVPARVGKGTRLQNPGGNGKNQYVCVDDPRANTAFNPHPITASAWALAETFQGYYETVISKGQRSWTIQRDYQGRMEACTWVSTYHACAITRRPVTKVWVHYAIVQKPGSLTFYVDGKQVATAGGTTQVSLSPFCIGAQSDAPNGQREWDGVLDEARVLKAEKDASWILLDYESQRPGATLLRFGATETK